MKEIVLRNSELKALVDDEDYDKVNQYKWRLNNGYAQSYINKSWPYLHRFILSIKDEKEHIDHIDDNGLNCQKSNLRICTNQQNTSNKRKRQGFTSKFKGVSWNKKNNKWRAVIMVNYKQHWIGYFLSEEEAAKAYDKFAIQHFGEFARLNFPKENN